MPDDVAARLKVRAAEAGQPLQAYLLGLVTREATRPTLTEIAQRAERYATDEVDNGEVLGLVDEGRAAR
nr:antitoxin [Streptomyces chumphonensis]